MSMTSLPLQIYALFHLNLAYSSISVEQRPEVVRSCYWPLLRLARKLDLPFAIEASAYTLETVAEIDPEWLCELCNLVSDGPCEFVGSGYAQLIGPLVPAKVNAVNLRLGNLAYERLLGFRPQTALVNEQAYSAGIVSHYLDAGYRSIIMEWNNPAKCHPEWAADWRYLPQYALGADSCEIPLIWNNSIYFQKFQRYVHGEMELDTYLDFIHSHHAGTPRILPLYGNDVEIFDFRPGRYHTEADLHAEGEWLRIERLFAELSNDERIQLIAPRLSLQLLLEPGAGNRLALESAEEPVPVKKQEKYNATRWAVTGRDDLGINTICWRIYAALKEKSTADDNQWQELCYLWSSDFRTHITEERWAAYRRRLRACEEQFCPAPGSFSPLFPAKRPGVSTALPPDVAVRHERHLLEIESSLIKLRLNCARGLAVEALCFKEVAVEPLCGTLPHGFFDDISLGADYYTGHLVMETPARHRITDLLPVVPELFALPGGGVTVCARLANPLGEIEKWITIRGASVELTTVLNWSHIPLGSLRLATVTLNPDAFDRESLFYRTHNGGFHTETFPLRNNRVSHGEAASFLVSARQLLGVTEGFVEFGDDKKTLKLVVDRRLAALTGQISYRPAGDSYFARCAFSACEMDETSQPKQTNEPLICVMTISAFRNDG